ncbi:1,2-phenylacetyl-CoA epoxidase subunit PaaC [Ferviditalea candida]|uniref:1,2-phenylacetyl-CoA epoxidase subunit PaaC n=1 Tax=Ferviditalea candida TaxID=3108399 RepID=A0ABU5ZIG1_9BACL|nr:1,2-phenylacetyl-CoA epoxidase subunit PaaC [Paenibacillaceae bacterium T2]
MAELQRIVNAEQAKEQAEYLAALKELLFQMADDDLMIAYRGSEWLGLAPHIEEDVAFSSMSQDTMGHAVMFYTLLEELGAGKADDLAQLRDSAEFRNTILVERANGTGNYMVNPHFDWAYSIVRFYLYDLFKLVRLEVLSQCSYIPLAQVSRKMLTELNYHLMHWRVWIKQLANSTEDARERLMAALEKVNADIGDAFKLGPMADAIIRHGLMIPEKEIRERWERKANEAFHACGINWTKPAESPQLEGRAGQHTEDCVDAVRTLSEVYRLDPATSW